MGTDCKYVLEYKDSDNEWNKIDEKSFTRSTDLHAALVHARPYKADTPHFDLTLGMPKHWEEPIDPDSPWVSESISDRYHGFDSFRHLSLNQLKAYDWDKVYNTYGYLNMSDYAKWRSAGRGIPPSYSHGPINGKHVFNDEYELIQFLKKLPDEISFSEVDIIVKVKWECTPRKEFYYILEHIIKEMETYLDRASEDDIIMTVMFF